MKQIIDWLKGKKTYILGILTILSILVQVIVGDLELTDAIKQIADIMKEIWKLTVPLMLMTTHAKISRVAKGDSK